MKTSIIGFVLGISVVILPAFIKANYIPNESTAEVNKIDDFYVFTDSKPVLPFDLLGDVDLGFVSGTQYEDIKLNLIKRAKKKFPDGDGIILNLDKKGIDKCIVIQYK
ncbi:MAG: hypothetical protein KA736_01465 [Crocinitomicaceae bacterium]|nr:hypothetical protein [Crocinitomicaceae bacterium]MBP6032681.1 hypothetical protein [Crocinitomicaceae bacterium]